MITKLTPIAPGESVSPQHVNAVIVRVNELIDEVNALAAARARDQYSEDDGFLLNLIAFVDRGLGSGMPMALMRACADGEDRVRAMVARGWVDVVDDEIRPTAGGRELIAKTREMVTGIVYGDKT